MLLNVGQSEVLLDAAPEANAQAYSFTVPPIRRMPSEGPCNVSLYLDVNGVSETYFLGTFQARRSDIAAAFEYAFNQRYVIISIVLCGILGWGNSPYSNVFMHVAAFIVSLLFIIPETGVFFTSNGYDIRNFFMLRDPFFDISITQLAFVIVYTMLFLLMLLHLTNAVLSLPLSFLRRLSERLFFHRKRENVQLLYVKHLLNGFRWAYKSTRVSALRRHVIPEFSYMKEAKMMIAGTINNKDAFFFPLRLQVSLLISSVMILIVLVLMFQAVYSFRLQVYQTVMPFIERVFEFLRYLENIIRYDESQNQAASRFSRNPQLWFAKLYAAFFTISSYAEELIFAVQTSAYVGISFGLLRFLMGQFSLLLVARSNLLAARKGLFKIDPTISHYTAFFFIGRQIACSLLGFVVISFLVAIICFVLSFEITRTVAFNAILSALPVIIFAILVEVMECVEVIVFARMSQTQSELP